MKNNKENPGNKDQIIGENPGEPREISEGNPSHREAKILLGVIAGVLILLIGGSAFVNFQNNEDGRLKAMEEALLNNKGRMLRDYDPLLVNRVEIHDYEVTHQGRDHDHVAVKILMPNLEKVYDDYFDQMIRQEVWLNEDPGGSLQKIYRRAVEQGERSVYPLEEEILLKEENDRWQVKNPEALKLILPHNPTEEIAQDFERVLETMKAPSDFTDQGMDPVLQEVMSRLLEEGFFTEISFGWHRGQGEGKYRLTAEFNEIMKMQGVGALEDFRHRRKEIVDRESLVQVIIDEIKKKTAGERDLRVFEVRKVNQPNREGQGYRLISRGGSLQYYRQLMEGIETFPHMARINFTHLENYYKTLQVTDGDPWPKPLKTMDYEKEQVLARKNTTSELKKLILEAESLLYRIYDPVKGEVTEEILIGENIPKRKVLDEEGASYPGNEIRTRKGYDLVVYGEGGEYIHQVDRKAEAGASEITVDAGDFHREEIFYLGRRPYHMGERGQGMDGIQKELQLTDINKEQVVLKKTYDQLSQDRSMVHSNYFVSEAHDLLLLYHHGPKELVEEIFPRGNMEIYRGTEEGLKVEETLQEVSRKVGGVQSFVVMDRDRIFLMNHQREQWILDLRKNRILSLGPGLFEKPFEEEADQDKDASEEGSEEGLQQDFEDYHYRFNPLGNNQFLVEGFIHSNQGEEYRREIWTVTDQVTRNIVFSREEPEYTLTYSREDDVFIVMKGQRDLWVFQGDPAVLKSLTGDEPKVKIEDLSDHEAFTLLERYEKVNEGREPWDLLIFGRHYFFSSHQKFYSPESHREHSFFRYDRDRGNLFFSNGGASPYMRVLQREGESPLYPLWDYKELKIDGDFSTLYFRDHQATRIYELSSFLEALKGAGGTEKGASGTE